MHVKFKLFVILILFYNIVNAQEPLPAFSVKFLGGNKAQISWVNPYENCKQISIQKSYDSLRFFQTIFTTQSPELPANGYVDNNYLPQIKTWYRIFYVTDSLGTFFFTNSQTPSTTINKPIIKNGDGISNIVLNPITLNPPKNKIDSAIAVPIVKPLEIKILVYYKNNDSLLAIFNSKEFLDFKDSLSTKTKDTLFSNKPYEYLLKPYVPIIIWKPSIFVFSNKKGAIEIHTPKYKTHHYKLIIYNELGKELFKIKHIQTDKLILEKSNFLQIGWYKFELFEDDKLKEKNKFLVEKD